MGRKKVPVNVLLPEEMNEKIKDLATEVRRSRSAYIRQILRRYLQYVETRDDPSAEKGDWDFGKIWRRISSGVPKEE